MGTIAIFAEQIWECAQANDWETCIAYMVVIKIHRFESKRFGAQYLQDYYKQIVKAIQEINLENAIFFYDSVKKCVRSYGFR